MLKFFSGPINDSCAFRLSIVDEKSRRCEYSLCDQGVVTRTISKAKRQEACEARDDLSFLVDTHLEQTFLGDPKLVGSPAKPDASCLAFQVNGESFFNCNGVAMRWDPEERAYLYMDDGAHNEKLLFVRAFMGLPPPEGH